MTSNQRRLLSLLLLAVAMGPSAALAQAADPYASKPTVELVVIFPAGSSADISARLLDEGLAQALATAVPVITKPGAVFSNSGMSLKQT